MHGTPIYARLLLTDPSGASLVDTAEGKTTRPVLARGDALPLKQHGPVVRVEDQDNEARILLTIPCFHDSHHPEQSLTRQQQIPHSQIVGTNRKQGVA